MSTDQIISLLASIGACLAAIAAFLSILQIKRQKIESYRPDPTFASSSFFAYGHKDQTRFTWSDKEIDQRSTAFSDYPRYQSGVPLHNIGFGVAKNVSLRWNFPIEDFTSTLNKRSQDTSIPIVFSYSNGIVSTVSEEKSRADSFWLNQRDKYLDFLLPLEIHKEATTIEFPPVILDLVSAYIKFTLESKNENLEYNIPSITIEVKYQDIGGSKHCDIFEIDLELSFYRPETSTYPAYFSGYTKTRKKSRRRVNWIFW